MSPTRFSKRLNLDRPEPAEITVRYDATGALREFVPALAADAGLTPKPMRTLVCRILRVAPDANNWSEYPNIAGEVDELMANCPWYKVYDIIEEVHRRLARGGYTVREDEESDPAEYFEEEINAYFIQNGIGWQLADGQIMMRGSEIFEDSTRDAIRALDATERSTARDEIHEAISDLSRRPEPDTTGAIQHALAALECVARDITGDSKATLGDILKRYPQLVPAPLNVSIQKAWGYASEHGRHLREGRKPKEEEAELLVGIASVVAIYLVKKAHMT